MVEFGQVYLDSSVIVARTLARPEALIDIQWDSAISSELAVAELLRTLDRIRLAGKTPIDELVRLREDAERNLSELTLVPVSTVVLRRAGAAFMSPVKTLDAIHLATAVILGRTCRRDRLSHSRSPTGKSG